MFLWNPLEQKIWQMPDVGGSEINTREIIEDRKGNGIKEGEGKYAMHSLHVCLIRFDGIQTG